MPIEKRQKSTKVISEIELLFIRLLDKIRTIHLHLLISISLRLLNE
jgi:hypothetical protein